MIVASIHPSLLLTPKDGAAVKKQARLQWRPVKGANYYNVQVFFNTTKVLSAWPTKPWLVLKGRWKWNGHTYGLARGVYTWYVWPGFGTRAAAHYGDLLGSSTFRVLG